MAKKKKEEEKRYIIEVNERQLWALEHGCETLARLICGQAMTYQEIFEAAWHKNVQEKQNLEMCGREFWDMREEVEEIMTRLKALCWNQGRTASYGIRYSEETDILYDFYQCCRYQRYLDMPPERQEQCRMTVMSDTPLHSAECPLPIIKRIDNQEKKKKKNAKSVVKDEQ